MTLPTRLPGRGSDRPGVPDTDLLYDDADIARMAGCSPAHISDLVDKRKLSPDYIDGGKRYWGRLGVFEAVRIAKLKPPPPTPST